MAVQRLRGTRSKRPVAAVRENRNSVPGRVARCEVDVAVPVEVRGDDGRRKSARAVRDGRRKRPATEVLQDADAVAVVTGDREVERAIRVEVRDGDRVAGLQILPEDGETEPAAGRAGVGGSRDSSSGVRVGRTPTVGSLMEPQSSASRGKV